MTSRETVSPYEREFTEFDEYIGEDGIPTLTGPVTPIQELLQFKMGVENTTFALTRMTPLQCAAYGQEKLERTRGLGPFMLSTGDSTAAGTPVENLRAITEIARKESARWRRG